MIDEKELERVCRLAGLVKITTAKVPTYRTKTGDAAIELVKLKLGIQPELRVFWFIEGERNYEKIMDDLKICSVLQAFEKETSNYEPIIENGEKVGEKLKAENRGIIEDKTTIPATAAQVESTGLMPERLTENLVEKIQKMPFSARLMHFQNTAAQYVKHRPGRAGGEYCFVEGHYMHQVLNLVSNFTWESYVEGWKETEKEVICWGHIVVAGVSKAAVGQADIKFRKDGKGHLCLGDDYKAAMTDMEKKAASKFGIAIDVYRGEV